MAEELRAIRGVDGDDTPALAQTLTRLVVLPFRVLRPDAETDFLAFSLAGRHLDVVVRHRLAGRAVERHRRALCRRRAGLCGRRRGGRCRPRRHGHAAPIGRPVAGGGAARRGPGRHADHVTDGPVVARRPVQPCRTTSPAASSRRCRSRWADPSRLPRRMRRTTPARTSSTSGRTSWRARYEGLPRARDLYQRCLELDSRFAPAWAHLGRCHRVIGKFIDSTPDSEERAEEAFRRALELNPRLSVAHKFYANLEADIGQAQRALVRLLGEATRHGNDPELFAGLVHACRYCGLFEESIAAHAEARRLDPNVPTSVEQTLLMTGDIDRLLARRAGSDCRRRATTGIRVIALGLAGRRDEARRALIEMRQTSRIPAFQSWTDHLMAWLDRRPADMLVGISRTQRVEDSGRPGGDLPGGLAALRRRRARQGA